MNSTLEAIQFFANSANSVRVFETLADGSTTSSELSERTGASRSTVGRILDEGESRGWIESAGSRYELTATGEIMIEEFRAYMETIEGVRYLGVAIDWLPPPAHDIDYRDLRDAEVTTSTTANPAAPFDRGIELIRAADQYRGLTSTAIPRYVEEIRNRLVREADWDCEGVIEASFIETLRGDLERVAPWYELAEAEVSWIYDGRVPINMHVVDDTVMIWLGDRDDGLEVYGLLESSNPNVRSWAESLYEEYRAEAELLDGSMLPDT